MLVQLTPRVNFTNIFRAAFVLIFLCQKSAKCKKASHKLLYEKAERKMLVKLTPDSSPDSKIFLKRGGIAFWGRLGSQEVE